MVEEIDYTKLTVYPINKLELWNLYKKQLSFFASKGRGYKSDIVMASWFPMKVVRRLQTARFDDMMVEYSPSFSGINTASWNDAPWR